MDDDGQDADPLLLQPPELVEHGVAELDELARRLALRGHRVGAAAGR